MSNRLQTLAGFFFVLFSITAVPARGGDKTTKLTKFTVNKASFEQDIQRLIAASLNGTPAQIEIMATSTIGWGCPCPSFAHKEAYNLDLTELEEAYLKIVSAKNLSNIQDFLFPGDYRIRGYYTGRSAAPTKREKMLLRSKKQTNIGFEFVATDWCYFAPKNYDPSQCYLDDAKKAGMRWCGPPIKELCRTLK